MPDAAKIAKLPIWAQDYIRDLNRLAENASQQYLGATTPNPESDIYLTTYETVTDGFEQSREIRHIAINHVREVNFRLFDTEVSVLLRSHDRRPSISITFDSAMVAPMPWASNMIYLEYRPRWEPKQEETKS